MACRSRQLVVVGCVVATAVSTHAAADPQAGNPVVAITIENASAVTASSLAKAQSVVSEIFDRAGVTVRWDPAEATAADRVLIVTLVKSATFTEGVSADAMGVAPSPGDGTRGTRAYVFVDRVAAFATKYRVAPMHVLACALAHEVGHLLLPPNAHRPDSVMREGWHPSLFPPRSPAVLGFPPDQARLLRLRARRAP